MRNVLVLGATSAIALHAMRRFASDHDVFFLVARDAERLQTVKDDLLTRGAERVEWAASDLGDEEKHRDLIERAQKALGQIDVVLLAYGTLGDQKEAEQSFESALKIIQVNFLSAISLLTYIANIMEKQGQGSIAAISSVAGDRGRQSNYIYGCSKGGLNIFLQGLRNRMASKGVNVITVKPGFVDTPMTAHIKKGPLFASPEAVGEGIYKAIRAGKSVVYLPWFWLLIMFVIRHIPETIFKRLKL